MKNKCIMFIVCLMLFLSFLGFAAEKDKKEKSGNFFDKDFALIFNLSTLIDPDNFDDGFQLGGGFKAWFTDTIAVRLLLHLYHESISEFDTSETDIGLSGGVERHFDSKKLSPYIGGLVGTLFEMETDADTLISFYFGGFIGVELELYKTISLFAEYDLLVSFYDWGYTIEFGSKPEAQIGLLLYF